MSNAGKSVGSTYSVYLVAFLSFLFFWTSGLAIRPFPSYYVQWIIAVFLICLIIFIYGMIQNRNRLSSILRDSWVRFCILYAALVILQGCSHELFLGRLADSDSVNVLEVSVEEWRQENIKFTILYLYFPILCLIQYIMVRSIGTSGYLRGLSIALILGFVFTGLGMIIDSRASIAIAFRAGRFRGLFSSPNSFAHCALFLIPVFILAAVRCRGLSRIWFGTIAFLFGIMMVYSGSRSAMLGMFLVILMFPVIAVSYLPIRSRTIRLLIVGLLWLAITTTVIGYASQTGDRQDLTVYGTMGRLVESWHKLRDDGIRGVLFENETRGRHGIVATAMTMRSPLAGFGPGGYYREYPNISFMFAGRRLAASDSALNHYLMISADLGIPLLLINLVILWIPVIRSFREARRENRTFIAMTRYLLTMIAVAYMVSIHFLPPSYFPDTNWVWTGIIAYLAAIKTKDSEDLQTARKNYFRWSLIGCVPFIAVASGVLLLLLGPFGYHQRRNTSWWPNRYECNCFPVEESADGLIRWCGKSSSIQIPISETIPDTMCIEIAAHHPDLPRDPLRISYGGISGVYAQRLIFNSDWTPLKIPTDSTHVYTLSVGDERNRWHWNLIPGVEEYLPEIRIIDEYHIRFLVLTFDVSRTWKPSDWYDSADERNLGIVVKSP